MIIVHYLEHSRAHRILWLLEELGLGYEVRVYPRRSDMRAPAELKAIHPLGKSPVIEDGGLVIAESGAIFDYLLSTYGDHGLMPAADPQAHRDYVYWMHYSEGSAMPLLVMSLVFSAIPGRLPLLLRPFGKLIATGVQQQLLAPQLADHIDFWERSLAPSGWFAGDGFTAADIMMSFPVEASSERAGTVAASADRPAIARYLAAIRARPAYGRALQRGGAYRYGAASG